ncbi:MAG: amidohydrolase [Granulosicoccus sp.]
MLRSICLLFLLACVWLGAVGYVDRPVVLVNGHILTMDAENTVISALGVHSERIRAAGEQQVVEATMSRVYSQSAWYQRMFGIRYVDLHGQTVVPGFVDAHSHFPSSGLVDIGIDLSSPPFGVIDDIPALLETITGLTRQQSDKRWIIGFDYDDAALSEQRHPTRTELDNAAPEHAVYIRHRSGHMGVANSRALGELGFEGDDPRRVHGLLQEKAAPPMSRLLREIPWWRLPVIMLTARDDYLQAGITTVQNGFADKSTLQVLRYAKKLGFIPQRIVIWPAHDKLAAEPSVALLEPAERTGSGTGGQRLAHAIDWPLDDRREIAIGAIKLIADGSPQGRTAWLSEPYLHDESLGDGYRGFANIEEKTLHKLILKFHRAGFQLALHGNGDAAIQSIIDGLVAAQSLYPRTDARHFIVHAQTITHSQLEMLSRLDVAVTFFPTHTFYWGDWYRQRVLGETRASMISPLASADKLGVRYTIHSDSPVTPISPMQMLWSASERQTTSGYLIGEGERVSRLRALRALTIDAAWQNFLDHDRGSIETGKLADFVVLSGNPLTQRDVRDISVSQVWIGGKRRLSAQP